MKGIIFCLIALLYFSCSDTSEVLTSNNLTKRVLLLESYDQSLQSGSYVSDSIVEYYENKLIFRRDHFYRRYNDPFIGFYRTYIYDQNNVLLTIDGYNDTAVSEHYLSVNYSYNNDNNIQEIHSRKFMASNFSDNLYDITKYYEYDSDTIRTYSIDHLDSDTREDLKTYIVYGSLDSINEDNKWNYVFDNQIDLEEINCIGDDCDTYYNKEYRYEDNREALISNMFGNDLNSFLLSSSFKYYNIELAKKYMDTILDIYPTNERNGNARKFNYRFDADNRLTEIRTSGSYATSDIIRYYYDQ